jgi:ABC-type lipoprotein release transport system permease subunit
MILWKVSFREMAAHRGRAILTAGSIVVGVAAVVAVRLSVDSVRQSFGAMQAAVSGEKFLLVDAPAGSLFPESLAETLAGVPGVREATPVYERSTVMYSGERSVRLVLVGVDPQRSNALRDYTLAEGQTLSGGNQLLLDSGFAAGARLRVGDEVRLLSYRGRFRATVAGLLRPRTAGALGRPNAGFAPLATLQRHFKAQGRINQIHVFPAAGADLNALQSDIAARLP